MHFFLNKAGYLNSPKVFYFDKYYKPVSVFFPICNRKLHVSGKTEDNNFSGLPEEICFLIKSNFIEKLYTDRICGALSN